VSDDNPPDNPPAGFLRIDFDRGREATFNSHVGNIYCKRGPKGTREEFVLGFRVHQHMCNPVGGLHGGMMMMVSMTCDFVAPARRGDWVEGRPELVRQTRSLLFTNIYLTVGEEKILRASAIAKIPSGEGQAFGRARLDRSAEVADPKMSVKGPPA
jgi:hypothetical protein